MRRTWIPLTFCSLLFALGAGPAMGSAAQDTTEELTEPVAVPIQHSQSGTGPCGFTIQRDLEGTVSVTPSMDDEGNLVLKIENVQLRGTLTNPENDRVVEIRWTRQGGTVGFEYGEGSANVVLGLKGSLNRGYDSGNTELSLDLPSDLAETIPFVPQGNNREAWAHVCAFLSEEEPAADTGAAARRVA